MKGGGDSVPLCAHKPLINPYTAEAKNKAKKLKKEPKPWHMGTHLRVLSESHPVNTIMAGFRGFSKFLRPCAFDESSLNRDWLIDYIYDNISNWAVYYREMTKHCYGR